MRSWRNWTRSRPSGRVKTLPVENAQNNAGQERGWTLRRRLLAILTLALLPVAAVSMLQGVMRARSDADAVRNQLIQSARVTASSDENLFSSAEQILRAVGNIADVRDTKPNCDALLADALIGVRYFSGLSRIDANGKVVCSATPPAKGMSVADRAVFHAARTSPNMVVSEQLVSRTTGQPVIGSMLAIRDPGGAFDGVVSIALDVRWIDYLLRASALPPGAVAMVFDRTGAVISANDMAVAHAIVPTVLGKGVGDGAVHNAVGPAGGAWRYATAALVGNNIFVAYAMRESRLFGRTYLQVGIDFLLPIAMILLAWSAIWIATDRQVTRWLVYLRRIAAAYRSGHYAIRPDLADAPSEFGLLGDAMSDMAASIEDRDRRLREAVVQKTLMIREIHHRVKNNLQIMMSLLNIQTNQVHDANAREALLQAQARISALALVHRILNQLEEQSTLDLKRLLEELSYQVAEGMGRSDHVRLVVDVPSREIAGPTAMALALFTVEALTNIYKYAYPDEREGTVRVSFGAADAGRLRLAITDDGIGFAADQAGKSVGARLIKTFGLQLGGVSKVHSEPGHGTIVELVFPDPDLRHLPASAAETEAAK